MVTGSEVLISPSLIILEFWTFQKNFEIGVFYPVDNKHWGYFRVEKMEGKKKNDSG
jgi:hypothetical protein